MKTTITHVAMDTHKKEHQVAWVHPDTGEIQEFTVAHITREIERMVRDHHAQPPGRPAEAATEDILFEHNTCVDAGMGWAHGQRPDPNGAHLMFYHNAARTASFVAVRGSHLVFLGLGLGRPQMRLAKRRLGVVGAESRDKNILQERLIDDHMRLIVTADHPWGTLKKILLDRLLSEPFIVRERGSGTLISIQERLQQQGRSVEELNIVAEMGSTEAVRQGIKDGIGVSILSTLAVSEDLESGALKALSVEGLNLTRGLYLTRHRQRSLSPLAQAFMEFLKKHLQR